MSIVFMILATLLVWVMTPGIAVFYGGFVPKKDISRILFDSFLMFGLAGLMWILIGYSASFEGDHLGIIGNLNHLFLSGVSLTALFGQTKLPTAIVILFQMMFAILTPALFIGAIANRTRIKFVIGFIILWSLLVYYPLVHMVWSSNGFLAKMGVLDFAGGTVIHIDAGITALVLSNFLLKPYKPAGQVRGNSFWILFGTSLLWIGWYGFNAGSALALNAQAIQAFLTTTVAPLSAMLTWITLENTYKGKITLSGICTGTVCGLVGETPGAGYVTIASSFIIGIISALGSYYFMNDLKYKLHINDYLDIFGSHGVSGIIGSLATGLFATKTVNPSVINGGLLVGGGFRLLFVQILGVLFTIFFVVTLNCLIVTGLKRFMKDDVYSPEMDELRHIKLT